MRRSPRSQSTSWARAVLLLGAVGGCADPPHESAHSPPRPGPTVPLRPAAAPARTTAPEAAPTASNPAPPPSAPRVQLLRFARLLEAPVHSLALGRPPRVAALGDDAYLDSGKGLAKLPKPPGALGEVRVFFGRDDQPRLLGFFPTPHAREGVYGRWRKGAWERGASEIGKLGSVPAPALYGVLGDEDPEVVCGEGKLCIVKRRTGWNTIEPLPEVARVELCAGVAWAVAGARVFRLQKDRFQELEAKATFTQGSGIWANGERDVWVSEAASSTLHHFDGGSWRAFQSPLRGPRGIWAASASDVWFATEGGALHWDGRALAIVEGPGESLRVVAGRSAKDVYFAGGSGVYRGVAE